MKIEENNKNKARNMNDIIQLCIMIIVCIVGGTIIVSASSFIGLYKIWTIAGGIIIIVAAVGWFVSGDIGPENDDE